MSYQGPGSDVQPSPTPTYYTDRCLLGGFERDRRRQVKLYLPAPGESICNPPSMTVAAEMQRSRERFEKNFCVKLQIFLP